MDDISIELKIGNETNGYLGSLYATTTNGTLSGIWNLSFGGLPLTNQTLSVTWVITPNNSLVGTPTTNGPILYTRETESSGSKFIVARAESSKAGVYENYHPAVFYGVVNVVGSEFFDDPYELSPGNNPFSYDTFWFTSSSRSNLLECFADSAYGNFFWWGHGNIAEIGYADYDETTNQLAHVAVTASEIASLTGNTNRIKRPYQLVVIHGCSVAGSPAFSKAFGIQPQPLLLDYYLYNGTSPRAFVAPSFDAPQISQEAQLRYAESLQLFFNLWMEGFTIRDCLSAAQFPPEEGETRIAIPLDGLWKIFGAVDLRRSDLGL